jgi:hypothetical protein
MQPSSIEFVIQMLWFVPLVIVALLGHHHWVYHSIKEVVHALVGLHGKVGESFDNQFVTAMNHKFLLELSLQVGPQEQVGDVIHHDGHIKETLSAHSSEQVSEVVAIHIITPIVGLGKVVSVPHEVKSRDCVLCFLAKNYGTLFCSNLNASVV